MDKYKLIRELGLQVFTKPLGPETMLVSADDLVSVLDAFAIKNYSTHYELVCIITKKPKTLEEKIQYILSDMTLSPHDTLKKIRDIVDKRND